MTAAQVPIPQVFDSYAWLEDADVSVGASTPLARVFTQGETTTVISKHSRNGANLDILATYGSGLIGVVHGLVPVGATGLTIDISAGGALAGGVLQSKDGFDAVVVNASSTNFIWFKQDGTIEVVDDSTTPPSGVAVYIGAAITNGSSVTSIDLSGVVYIYGGIPYRETTDPTQPTDSPPSTWIGLTKTDDGTYLFDGTTYSPVVETTSETVVAHATDYAITESES